VAAIPPFFDLLIRLQGSAPGIKAFISPDQAPGMPGSMSPFIALAFVLLTLLLLLIRASRGIASHIADFIAFLLALLGLAMVSGWLFAVLHVYGRSYVDGTPPATLAMLALLIVVAFSVRAQYGAFDILVGSGLGSRIARGLTPVLLVIPFVREAGRARIIRLHLLPENSESTILGSVAAMISLVLLVLIARHIRRMEAEIQRLSLRDELTGLNNLRGFRLLAEQALRLAYRSQTPFSVLFVDVDRLKEINDTLGHAVGSALLVETAALLNATFRETDVIARIGGDEFAVAGQFSRSGISIAADRLAEQASLTRIEGAGDRPLSLSIGFATTREHHHEFLQDLLDEADVAMYENKRRKRLQVC
jgi:diguanylate cyclase (GGDEF)-like protein